MKADDNKLKVYEVLVRADHRPMKSRDIAGITGLSDVKVRQAVHDLREQHFVKVCSGECGFWLWDGEDDSWEHTKAQIRSRYNALQRLYFAMEYPPDKAQITMEL